MNTNREDTIDLKELFFSLVAQWKLIMLCVILGIIVALLYLRLTPSIYSVDALVQVEENKGASAALLGDLSNVIDQNQPAQAEIEILKSRLVLGKAVHNLNLDIRIEGTNDTLFNRLVSPNDYSKDYSEKGVIFYDHEKSFDVRKFEIPDQYRDQEFLIDFKGKKFSLVSQQTKEPVFTGLLNHQNISNSPMGAWNIEILSQDEFNDSYYIKKLSLPAAVDLVLANFSVAEKGKLTGVLGLSYQGADKNDITLVLNNILASYSQQNIERRSAETAQTLKFLEEQLPQLKSQLDTAEREFNRFREQQNTVDVTKESELFLAQSVDLETKKVELQQSVAEAAAKYTSEHPVMKQMNAQLASINSKISALDETLKDLPDLQRRYLQLYREVEVKQELYTALLNSYQQLQIAKAGEIGNVRIIDTAVSPVEPIKPKKLITLILAIFMGAFIGISFALFRNMLRSGIKDSAQIESVIGVPVYAIIPRSSAQIRFSKLFKKNKNMPILAVNDSHDIAVESIRNIRTALHFTLAQAKNNIIAISGPAPTVGKSFLTINLAITLKQAGKRVLIIDADMRRGYLHQYLGLDKKPGLAELLMNAVDLDQVMVAADEQGVFFIPRGKQPTNPSELLSQPKFEELLMQLSTQFDHILIDTPPALAVTDGIIVGQQAGVNILVVRHAKTHMKELELTVSRFEQANVKVNGIILNDVENKHTGYGYGYGYNYQYAYKPKNDSIKNE